MIFIDEVQKSPQEVAQQFKVDLKKITKHGVFEINPKKKRVDKLNGGHRTPAGKNLLGSFWATDPNTNKAVKITYAESANPIAGPNNQIVMDYQPKKIMFPGEEFIMITDPGKALFFFLSKDCMNSPFRLPTKSFYFYLQDKEKEAMLRVQSKTKIMEALTVISDANSDRLKVLAKGIGLTGIDLMDDYQIKDQLIVYAEQNTDEFINHSRSKNTEFYGTIQNLVDKGAIVYKQLNGVDRWFWGTGPMINQEIVIVERGRNAFETLKEAIVDNADRYYKMVYDLNANKNSDDKLNKFLDEQEDVFEDIPAAPVKSARELELERKEAELAERERQVNIKLQQAAIQQSIGAAIPPAKGISETGSTDTSYYNNLEKKPTISMLGTDSDVAPQTQPKSEVPFLPNIQSPVPEDQLCPLPTTFNEAIDYLTRKDGKRPTNVAASQYLASLKEGK